MNSNVIPHLMSYIKDSQPQILNMLFVNKRNSLTNYQAHELISSDTEHCIQYGRNPRIKGLSLDGESVGDTGHR